MKLTPMLRQYLRLKEEHRDAILLFRLGDFYEMFFDDAEIGARILDIALTSRQRGEGAERVPLCGVPFHSARSYIAKLLAAGFKVAICEQVEDPAEARGLVDRAVVRVVTPGTVLDEEGLDPRQPNFLCTLAPGPEGIGLVAVEFSTGEVRATVVAEPGEAVTEIRRLSPREILVPEGATGWPERLRGAGLPATIGQRARLAFSVEAGRRWQCAAGGEVREGRWEPALAALGAAIGYLGDVHRGGLAHLRPAAFYATGDHLVIDEATQRNLELTETLRGQFRGSLLWLLDQAISPMGSRCLRRWLLYPLTRPRAIGKRLDAVEELVSTASTRDAVREGLAGLGDLERLAGRLGAGTAGARDLVRLRAALERIGHVRARLERAEAALLVELRADLDPLPEIQALIARAIADDPPVQPGSVGAIRDGYHPEVDELRGLGREGRRYLVELEARERARSGIGSLKVRYNKVFGYYIEVTKANLGAVPGDYVRKQTLVGAERFVTPELKDYEARVLGAEERLRRLEAHLLGEVVGRVAAVQGAVGRGAAALGVLDALAALAEVAHRRGYVRPRLSRGQRIVIREGRHPVVEAMQHAGEFVPNDCTVDPDDQQLLIVTGPNMAGKSTYLRQVALVVLLAQIGSYVPAADAEIGVVDRLFSRIGASDNLAGGESTFMVEMRETANILTRLSARSLVILDEIGRGTSTFDGISIAWAVAEYLHDAAPDGGRVKTLFATHYHELTGLARERPRVRNYSVAVREWRGDVVFLRRVVPEAASQSYGIHVARLAGVPAAVVDRARQILAQLEARSRTPAPAGGSSGRQIGLFQPSGSPIEAKLCALDTSRLTPIEALNCLHGLVEAARGRRAKTG